MTTSTRWLLTERPSGDLTKENFTLEQTELPPLQDGEVLVRTIYLSLDPTQRTWANATDTYLPAIELGNVMRGSAIGVVEESQNAKFQAGDLVNGMLGWQTHAVLDGRHLTPITQLKGVPLTAYMGLFSHIGLTAYYGLLDIGKPKVGETLVVSGAAGAVGSIVGQIGKIKGCHVVGIAGSDEKCQWLTEELGFDGAINYKSESVYKSLKRHCPDGIDIYFDNVGGKILDAALAQINIGARIPLCGMISQYNATEPQPGPYYLSNLIIKRARIEGFLVLDYLDRANEAFIDMAKWLKMGQLQYRVHVVDGLEEAPEALNLLFSGGNVGKLIVKVSEEPEG